MIILAKEIWNGLTGEILWGFFYARKEVDDIEESKPSKEYPALFGNRPTLRCLGYGEQTGPRDTNHYRLC